MMKRNTSLGIVLFMLCAGGMLQANPLLNAQLESRVAVATGQRYYADSIPFLMARADLQQHAYYQQLDEAHFAQGMEEVAKTYVELCRQNDLLYRLEMYSYLDKPMALVGTKISMADYLLKASKVKQRTLPFSSARYFVKMEIQLREHKKSFRNYRSEILALMQVRRQLADVSLDKGVAQATIVPYQLTPSQIAQVERAIALLQPFGKQLVKTDEAFLDILLTGLRRNPLQTKNQHALNLSAFLATYGRFTRIQADGVMLARAGERLVKQEQDADN